MSEEKNTEYPGLSDAMSMQAITFQPPGSAGGRRGGKLFAHSCRVLEVAAVIITCIYLAIQTKTMTDQSKISADQAATMAEQSRIMNEQTKQNRFTNQLQVALFLRDHYQTVNKILAEQREARDALKLNMSKVLAYMLISDYDAIYQMRKEGMIEDPKWAILEPFIRQQMKENRDIRNLWRAPGNHGRSPDFKNYVEACVYSDQNDSRIRPANPGIIGMIQNKTTKDWRDVQLKECPGIAGHIV